MLRLGLDAARRGEWPVAIRHLEAAQRRAYLSPQVAYNLGLAYARAQQEIGAVLWLRAYLSAVPDAPQGAEVRAEIARLEALGRRRLALLLDSAAQAAQQLDPKPQPSPLDGRLTADSLRVSALTEVAKAWAAVGDGARARALVQRAAVERGQRGVSAAGATNEEWMRVLRHRHVLAADDVERAAAIEASIGADAKTPLRGAWRVEEVWALLRRGEVLAASRALPKVEAERTHLSPAHPVFSDVVREYRRLGDTRGATRFVVATAPDSTWAARDLVEALVTEGDLAGARALVERRPEPGWRAELSQAIALARAARGELPAGRATVREALGFDAEAKLAELASAPLPGFEPGNHEDWLADLTYVFLRMRQPELAARAAQLAAKKIAPGYPGHQAARARAYVEAGGGDVDTAFASLRRGAARIPTDDRPRHRAIEYLDAESLKITTLLVDLRRFRDVPRATALMSHGRLRVAALQRAQAEAERVRAPAAVQLATQLDAARREATLGEAVPASAQVALGHWAVVAQRVSALAWGADADELQRLTKAVLHPVQGGSEVINQWRVERGTFFAVEKLCEAAVELDRALHLMRVHGGDAR